MRFSLSARGADAIVRKLQGDALYHDAAANLLDFGRREGETQGQKRAPRGASGTLAAGVGSTMHASARPMYASIESTGAVASDGFRYGFALNASPRYHYRAGGISGFGKRGSRLAKGGKPTKKWFTGILSLVKSAMKRVEKRAAQEVEQKWAR